MPDRREAEFDCTPESARAAREVVSAALAAWDLDDLVEVASLLTTELVTNAVLHARTAYRVAVKHRGHKLVVAVSDGSPARPVAPDRPVPWGAVRGRGLVIVEALAAAWGSRPAGPGKVVWFALEAS